MKFPLWFFAVLGLTVLGAGCSTVPVISVDTPEHVVDAVAADALTKLKISFDALQTNGNIWWILPEKKNVLIEQVPVRSVALTEAVPDGAGSPSYGPLTQSLASRVDQLLLGNGFKKDALNSSANLQDFSMVDIIQAYQRGNILCVFLINGENVGDSHSSASFQCSTMEQLSKAEAEQLPFIGIVHSPYDNQSQDVVISSIRYFPPLFAVVAVNYRRTGYSAILKKIDGVYVQVTAGQEAPYCKVVDTYEIPKEVVPECYLDGGVTTRKNAR